MKKKIQNLFRALHHLDTVLGKHSHQVVSCAYLNKGRHSFIRTNRGLRLYVLFKRAMFMTYNQQFEAKDGAAESINSEYLKKALELRTDYIVFIYENGGIYAITPERFDDKGVERVTEAGEKTVSLPMKELTGFEKILEVLA